MENRPTIPLTTISEHYPIRLGSFPPDRDKLLVDVRTLNTALKILDLRDTNITLLFHRDQPKPLIAPNGSGQESAVPMTVEAENEKRQKRKPLAFDPTGKKKILISIPYKDRQVKTTASTAKHLSQELGKVLANYKLNKYIYELMNLTIASSDVQTEIFMGTRLAATNIAFSSGIATAVQFRDWLSGTDLASFGQYFAAIYVIMYSIEAGLMIRDGIKYRQGKSTMEFDEYIAKDLRRAIYPAVLINNYLVPSFIYSINALSANDIIVPKSK